MRVAHERFAKLPWKQLIEPAIGFAEEGLLIDWFAVENIASAAADLNRYAASRQSFLVDGLPPFRPGRRAPKCVCPRSCWRRA
jgi:gamma-glutamyltranspeptidase/glutathione hydrolase